LVSDILIGNKFRIFYSIISDHRYSCDQFLYNEIELEKQVECRCVEVCGGVARPESWVQHLYRVGDDCHYPQCFHFPQERRSLWTQHLPFWINIFCHYSLAGPPHLHRLWNSWEKPSLPSCLCLGVICHSQQIDRVWINSKSNLIHSWFIDILLTGIDNLLLCWKVCKEKQK